MVNANIVVGDFVTTNSGYSGFVVAVLTGQLAGLIAVKTGPGNKGVTVNAYDAVKTAVAA
jgi:preprotein translocase subunit YajC